MRIRSETRFAHPVLATDTTDYPGCEFYVALEIVEAPSVGEVRIDYEMTLRQEDIAEEVQERRVVVGLFITCLPTYYSAFHRLSDAKGDIELPQGALRGRVSIRPILAASDLIPAFQSEDINPEFGQRPWSFRAGQVLGYGDEFIIDVGLDKLTSLETIFALELNKDVPEGEVRVDPSRDKIAILAGTSTFNKIHTLRGVDFGRRVLLNSVYLPAVMSVLTAVQAGDNRDTRWYPVLSAKCNHLGIDLDGGAARDTLVDAQKLLRAPLERLLNSEEMRDR